MSDLFLWVTVDTSPWVAVVCLALVTGWVLGRLSARIGRSDSIHNPKPPEARPPSTPPRPPPPASGAPWSEVVKGG